MTKDPGLFNHLLSNYPQTYPQILWINFYTLESKFVTKQS
jgi:hypothetical protein